MLALVAVLIAGQRYKKYTLERNEDLIAIIALFRPVTMEMLPSYIKRFGREFQFRHDALPTKR